VLELKLEITHLHERPACRCACLSCVCCGMGVLRVLVAGKVQGAVVAKDAIYKPGRVRLSSTCLNKGVLLGGAAPVEKGDVTLLGVRV
jgi:ribosomal protein S3